ncbi:spore germination protein GerPC [Sutcliffiella cohnii]
MFPFQQYVNDSQQKIRTLQEIVTKQNKQITALEDLLKTMQKEIIQLKEKPTMNIERIEYKFDQLKVETLEGTLNIGLTPGSAGAIEDFIVTQDNLQVPTQQRNEQVALQIEKELKDYLTKNGTERIKNAANHVGRSLEEHYYDFMIQDIAKQLPKKINLYLNELTPEAIKQNYSNDQIKNAAVDQIKKDMDVAFTTFIKNLPTNKGDTSS